MARRTERIGIAADAGDAGAQYLLASMYESGLGVPRDLALAIDWYTAAARQGDPAAAAKARELAEAQATAARARPDRPGTPAAR